MTDTHKWRLRERVTYTQREAEGVVRDRHAHTKDDSRRCTDIQTHTNTYSGQDSDNDMQTYTNRGNNKGKERERVSLFC